MTAVTLRYCTHARQHSHYGEIIDPWAAWPHVLPCAYPWCPAGAKGEELLTLFSPTGTQRWRRTVVSRNPPVLLMWARITFQGRVTMK